ncbi:MAG: Ig-like domain-containing protein [Caldilineaceae bacterium]
MNHKRLSTALLSHCLTVLLILSFLLAPLTASAQVAQPAFTGGGLTIAGAESFASGIGGNSAGGGLTLTSNMPADSRLTPQDYLNAYTRAAGLLQEGVTFRSTKLQRYDPAQCQAPAENPDACRFDVTGLQNNYLDFNGGKLYWQFCADYDDPYVGASFIPQAQDDAGNLLKISPFGYCPTWDSLTPNQKSIRSATPDAPNDVRNRLIEAQRIFAFLAIAEPASLQMDGLKTLTNGTVVLGQDGKQETMREVGIFGLLQATREIANVHLIFGNEFMVTALRYPFSVNDPSSQNLVEGERKNLEMAAHQYSLAVDALLYTLNFRLDEATGDQIANHFGDREFQTFAAASERLVQAQSELAKRDRLLGSNTAASTGNALRRLDSAYLDQYLQGLALAGQATGMQADNPQTTNVNESRLKFIANGGRSLQDNLRRLAQQTQAIRAGLNPLGYEDDYVPVVTMPELLSVANSLYTTAQSTGQSLADSQRTFDEKFDQLKTALGTLQDSFDSSLLELCGLTHDTSPQDGLQDDTNGDGLRDWDVCGPQDITGDGRPDITPLNRSGLIGQNYWDVINATNDLSLAKRRAENITLLIKKEEETSGQVISITLSSAKLIGAYQLAIGALNAEKETTTVASSHTETGYADISASVETNSMITVKGSVNPIACVIGDCDVKYEQSVAFKLNATGGGRFERTQLSSVDTVYDPNEKEIAGYQNLITLQQAIADNAKTALASQQRVYELELQLLEQLIEVDKARAALNKTIAEHNMLVEKFALTLSQRQSAQAGLQESYLAKPYFRLLRDAAALESAAALDRATQFAYLTAKAYEYLTLSPYPDMNEIFRLRNAGNLRTVLDKLLTRYTSLNPDQNLQKGIYNLSLAQDVFGLTNAVLNPTGALSNAEVDALRTARFQQLLAENRITNPAKNFDKIVIYFGTRLSNPEFIQGVWGDRIAGIDNQGPGCRGGCRGLWLNVVTNQSANDFTSQDKFPIIRLTHGGDASYRNALGEIVQYRVGPAMMVGETLPPGFTFKPGETSTIMLSHVNLPGGAEPNPNLKTNNFVNRSVATSKWAIEIDLNEGTNKNLLQLNQIRDIEIRFDTTYLTLPQFANVAAASQRMHDAEAAGNTPAAADADMVENWQATQNNNDLVQAATVQSSQAALLDACRLSVPNAGELYVGSLTVTDPVVLGRTDLGVDLHINADNSVTGHLRPECSPLFDSPAALAGSYNPATQALTVQTVSPLTRTIASRVAQRTIQISGVLSTTGVFEGDYNETITGYTQKPLTSHGELSLSRPVNDNFAAPATVNHPPLPVDDSFTVATSSSNNSFNVLTNDSDSDGQALNVVTVSPAQHGTATLNGNAILYTPLAGYTGADAFAYSISDGDLSSVATVNVNVGTVVTRTNSAPVARNQSITARPGQARNVTLAGTDADGDGLTYALVTQPAHGTLTGSAPNLVYTAQPNYLGADSFTFKVNDGKVDSAVATVSITVRNGGNAAPVADIDAVSTTQDSALAITLGCTDADGDPLSFTITTPPAHGELGGAAPDLLYIPQAGYMGTDHFVFHVSDGKGGTTEGAINITVEAGPSKNIFLPLVSR